MQIMPHQSCTPKICQHCRFIHSLKIFYLPIPDNPMFLIICMSFSDTGAETSLISLTSLPYETYLVPLKVADQQGLAAHSTLRVVVCYCGKGNVCQGSLPRSSSLHGGAIGILLGALLLMACACLYKIYKYSHTSANTSHN